MKKKRKRYRFPIITLLAQFLECCDLNALCASLDIEDRKSFEDELGRWLSNGEGDLRLLLRVLDALEVPEMLTSIALRLTAFKKQMDLEDL